MTIDAKQAFRRRVRAAIRDMPAEQRATESAAVVQAVATLLADVPQRQLASYACLGDECNVDALHAACVGSGICLPRVAGPGALAWYAVGALDDLVAGAYGIREPDPTRHPQAVLDAQTIVIVPATAFTADGARLGRGGGYYDRLLAAHDCRSIGVGFRCQLVDELPTEAHDRAVDALCIAGEWVKPWPGA